MLLSSAARDLNAELSGGDVRFTGCSADSRKLKPGQMFIALRGHHFDGHDFIPSAKQCGAAAAMVDRVSGVSMPLLRVHDTRLAMGRLAGLWRTGFDLRIAAVTGSNGKTTVKEMLASILSLQAPVLATQGNLNNDIGVPLTLFNIGAEHRYAVIEIGANHPGEITYLSQIVRPEVAVITQCAPAHLEGFGTIAGVAKAKAEIYEGLSQNGVAIINADDAFAAFWQELAKGRRQLSFGFTSQADVTAADIRMDSAGGSSRFWIKTGTGDIEIDLPLPGRHNIQNALAATACALALDIPKPVIQEGLARVRASKGRLQMKRGRTGALIIDDTYNANPASLEAALNLAAMRGGRRWLVLGDMGELGVQAGNMHTVAGERARELGFERLYALGPLSGKAVAGFGSGARHFADADSLTETLLQELANGVTVLIKGSRAMAMERIVQALAEEQS